MAAESLMRLLQPALCSVLPLVLLLLLDAAQRRQCKTFARSYKAAAIKSCSFGLMAVHFAALLLWWLGILLPLSLTLSFITGSAGALVLSLLLVLSFYALSLIKFKVLHEPLVFSDLLLVKEVLSCPRFYLGYVTTKQWLALGLLFCALAALKPLFESSRTISISDGSHAGACFLSLLTALLLWSVLFALASLKVLRAFRAAVNTWLLKYFIADACKGAAALGPAAYFMQGLLLYLFKARWPQTVAEHQCRCSCLQQTSSKGRADLNAQGSIVLLQAESLIDLTSLFSELSGSAVQRTALDAQASLRAELQLDYFGAYTMRTEFHVLTGLDPKALGAYAYDPYLLAAKRPLASLASMLKSQGYYCICMHANSGRFFNRRRVMRQLGFDECVFAEELKVREPAARAQSSVQPEDAGFKDAVLYQYAAELLDEARADSRKLFIFMISLDGHGPYRQQRASAFRAEGLSSAACYLHRQESLLTGTALLQRHLGEADCLMVYGDHLPPLSSLFRRRKNESGLAQSLPRPVVYGFNLRPSLKADRQVIDCGQLHALLLQQGGFYA